MGCSSGKATAADVKTASAGGSPTLLRAGTGFAENADQKPVASGEPASNVVGATSPDQSVSEQIPMNEEPAPEPTVQHDARACSSMLTQSDVPDSMAPTPIETPKTLGPDRAVQEPRQGLGMAPGACARMASTLPVEAGDEKPACESESAAPAPAAAASWLDVTQGEVKVQPTEALASEAGVSLDALKVTGAPGGAMSNCPALAVCCSFQDAPLSVR